MAAKPRSSVQGQRQLRVGELVRHALSEILQRGEVMDPVLERHVVTISEVQASPDLKHATAFVMPLGGQDEAEVVAALRKHARFLRGQVARRVDLKHTPELRFEPDTTYESGARMDALLDSLDTRPVSDDGDETQR